MSDVALRVLALEVHCFVDGLDSVGVSARVIRQLNLLADADALGLPVKKSHIDRASDLSCDEVVAGLPFLHGFSGSLGGDGEVETCPPSPISSMRLLTMAAALPLSTGMQPTLRRNTPTGQKKNSFLIITCAVRVKLRVEKVGDHKVPDGSVRHTEDDAFALPARGHLPWSSPSSSAAIRKI